MVVGLEPSDVVVATVILHTAEAQERGHLVMVALHGLLHQPEAMHERIGFDQQQGALAMKDAPKQLIECAKRSLSR